MHTTIEQRAIYAKLWDKYGDPRLWPKEHKAENVSEEHMQDVVCGDIVEPVERKCRPLALGDEYVASPSIGGILIHQSKLKAYNSPRSIACSAALCEAYADNSCAKWVVCKVRGNNVALLLREAYERGLKENKDWGYNRLPA